MYLTLETLAGGPQICYYHYDGLGSVTDLSNSSGVHTEHYYYDPFGNTRIYDPATGMRREESIISNPYRFTARRWDSESSLYYYRARMYDPKLGRFLQTDPIGYDAGDMNLYRYCGNNPLNSKDPLGRCDDTRIEALMEELLRVFFTDRARAFEIAEEIVKMTGLDLTVTATGSFTGVLGLGYLVSATFSSSGEIITANGLGLGVGEGIAASLSRSHGDTGPVYVALAIAGGSGVGGFGEASLGFSGGGLSYGAFFGGGAGVSVTGNVAWSTSDVPTGSYDSSYSNNYGYMFH